MELRSSNMEIRIIQIVESHLHLDEVLAEFEHALAVSLASGKMNALLPSISQTSRQVGPALHSMLVAE